MAGTMEINSLTEADPFFREYTSREAIVKYTRATAGLGISYLLDHDYKDIYLQALALLPVDICAQGMRVLEFGCGAGMNLLHLLRTLREQGIKVAGGVGTDFSPVLIETARAEAKNYLSGQDFEKVQFCVAKNESLLTDLSASTSVAQSALRNSFHFIIGVNTIRYCHAINKEMDNARDIFSLLAPGGICVVIDMNDRFPLFRSDVRNWFRLKKEEQCYVPSLEEYAIPFAQTGFEMIRQEHFCWVPHSARRIRLQVMKAMSPMLNVVAKSRAMRSLVVARKPILRG
jgi:SAM-dependent methyltransferase